MAMKNEFKINAGEEEEAGRKRKVLILMFFEHRDENPDSMTENVEAKMLREKIYIQMYVEAISLLSSCIYVVSSDYFFHACLLAFVRKRRHKKATFPSHRMENKNV